MAAALRNKDYLISKVKLSLNIPPTDSLLNAQIEQLIGAALDLFINGKGINEKLLYEDSGILLTTIYVSDMWQTGGEFKFSPATLMLLDSLMDNTRGIKYANAEIR